MFVTEDNQLDWLKLLQEHKSESNALLQALQALNQLTLCLLARLLVWLRVSARTKKPFCGKNLSSLLADVDLPMHLQLLWMTSFGTIPRPSSLVDCSTWNSICWIFGLRVNRWKGQQLKFFWRAVYFWLDHHPRAVFCDDIQKVRIISTCAASFRNRRLCRMLRWRKLYRPLLCFFVNVSWMSWWQRQSFGLKPNGQVRL